MEAKVAAGVGARFADPLPFFNPPGALEAPTICLLTNMCTTRSWTSTTDLGYKVLGGLVLQQYLLGLGAGGQSIPQGPWSHFRVGLHRLP